MHALPHFHLNRATSVHSVTGNMSLIQMILKSQISVKDICLSETYCCNITPSLNKILSRICCPCNTDGHQTEPGEAQACSPCRTEINICVFHSEDSASAGVNTANCSTLALANNQDLCQEFNCPYLMQMRQKTVKGSLRVPC